MKFVEAIKELQNNPKALRFSLLLVKYDTIEMLIDLDTMNLYPLYGSLGDPVSLEYIKELISYADDWRSLSFAYSDAIKIEEKMTRYTPKIYYEGVYDGISTMDDEYPTLYYSCDYGINSNGVRLWITLPDRWSDGSHSNNSMNFNRVVCMNIVTPRILTIHRVSIDSNKYYSEANYINVIQNVVEDAKSSVIIIHDRNELKGIVYFHSMKELMNISDEYIQNFDSSKLSAGDLLKFGYARIEFNVDDNGDIVNYTPILSFTPPSYNSIIDHLVS